jgi:hypothetical protein
MRRPTWPIACKRRLVAHDPELDLALLKVEGSATTLPVLPMGDPAALSIGSRVLAIGHPEQGGLWSLTTGVISAEWENFTNVPGKHVFQTETGLNRGNSGGPLIDENGQQIGVNTSMARKAKDGLAITSISFAVKSSVAKEWLAKQGVQVAYAKSIPAAVEGRKEPVQPESAPAAGGKPQAADPSVEQKRASTKPQPSTVLENQPEAKPETGPGLPPVRPVQSGSAHARAGAGERRSGIADGPDAGRNSKAPVRSDHGAGDRLPRTVEMDARKRPGLLRSPARWVDADRTGVMAATAVEPPATKLDCSVYETKSMNVSAAFTVAQFIFNIIPSIGFSRTTGVAWDKVVHGTIARYVELCNRYNAGLVDKAEYEARLKEIEALYKETKDMEEKLFTATRQRAKNSSDEMDEMLGRKRKQSSLPPEVEASVKALADKVDSLDPIGKPLKPAAPCKPPDMLGAPGAQPETGRNC